MTERQRLNFLDLPAEIRVSILEYVFDANLQGDGFRNRAGSGGIVLDEDYTAAANMAPLLTCRHFYYDASCAAIARTPFVIRDTFTDVARQLASLHPKQVESIRSIAFLAGLRQFQKMQQWGSHPFGMPSLRLQSLAIVFHRSSYWHYPSDHNHEIVKLLRNLEGVEKIIFVRNGANIKGHFKTWYNRLIGFIMKEDHHRRYNCKPPVMEKVWWSWSYDDAAEAFYLEAKPAKPVMEEEKYMEMMKPLVLELTQRMENEEWDPDPRARNGF
ncbi:hypothetical protein EV356DRAFT_508383 [Viridothelium virens]|uniref:Uncharacterized protein n=1 Tax=Viridothelium virens TaxID=1048519 RepID=A0A6A6GXY4_VIRVR|nr:hypothetical protein EV356DRAFT_508383 [Viridothelium virens]